MSVKVSVKAGGRPLLTQHAQHVRILTHCVSHAARVANLLLFKLFVLVWMPPSS